MNSIIIPLLLVFTPFTLIRYGYLGIPEVGVIFLLLWLLFSVGNRLSKSIISQKFIFSKFWVFYLSTLFLGVFYRYVATGVERGGWVSVKYDLYAYLFLLLTSITLEWYLLRVNKTIAYHALFANTFYITCVIMGGVYAISLFSSNLFGFPLYYQEYFSPLSKNIHHVAMYLAPMPFIGLFVMQNQRSIFERLLTGLGIILVFWMGYKTGSFKILLGWSIALVIIAIYIPIVKMNSRRTRFLYFIMTVTILIVSVTFSDTLRDSLFSLFYTYDLNGARNSLYGLAFQKGMESPVVGFGPGSHIKYYTEFMDAHQTLLTVFMQGGVLGLLGIVGLFGLVLNRGMKNIYLLAAVVTIIVYGLGGDILRRLPVWMILIVIYYGMEKYKPYKKERFQKVQ